MKTLASIALVTSLAATVLVSSPAYAAEGDAEGYVTHAESDGYGVTFLDDLLGADGIDAAAPLIRASFRPLRGLLIRPRTSFVPELLGTANDL
jgi:hypothetical protein